MRNRLLDALGGRQRLEVLYPRVEDAIQDPQGHLTDHPIRIGTIRRWPAMVLLAVFGPLMAILWMGPGWLGMLCAGLFEAVAVVGVLIPRPHLVFSAAGLQIKKGKDQVFLPYSALNPVSGATVHTINGQDHKIVMQANPAAIGAIVKTTRDGEQARGSAATIGGAFKVLDDGEVVLEGQYRVRLSEIAWLLRHLYVTGPAAPDQPDPQPVTTPRFVTTPHSVSLPSTSIVFPSICCICGCETTAWSEFRGGPVGYRALLVMGYARTLALRITCCRPCHDRRWARDRTQMWRYVLLGGALGLCLGLTPWVLPFAQPIQNAVLVGIAAGTGAFCGYLLHLLGSVPGTAVRIRSSWMSSRVKLWFAQKGYAQRVAKASGASG